MTNQQKLIVIVGATASGKTSLALALAKKYQGYIISADSRQIYQGLDIGTAKPPRSPAPAEQKTFLNQQVYWVENVPHFLIDIITPDEEFTLADYQREVFAIIAKNKSQPWLVGGTGLYLSSIIDNYQLPQGKINQELKAKLARMDSQQLRQQLKRFDPHTYEYIDKNNKRRLVRALEYVITNQQSFYEQIKKSLPRYQCLLLGLYQDKAQLDELIKTRVELMLSQGLIAEVAQLLKKYPPDRPAFDTIGYQETKLYLQGQITRAELAELIVTHTRQYAKRQLTWWKRYPQINWIKDFQAADELIANFLT